MKIVLFILIVLMSCNDRGSDDRDSTDPSRIEPVRDYTKDSLKKDSARFVQIQTPKGEQ